MLCPGARRAASLEDYTKRLPIELSVFMKIVSIGLALSLAGCAARHQNETIGGVVVPIPAAMKKLPASEDWVDLGLEHKGEQVSFRGEMSSSEIVQFYQNVLPALPSGLTKAIRTTSTLTVFAKNGEFKPSAR